jgi:hypothetical protein
MRFRARRYKAADCYGTKQPVLLDLTRPDRRIWCAIRRPSSRTIVPMPLTVFDIKGIPGNRREHIEAAVVSGGRHLTVAYEAWIAADPFRGGFRLLITGPQGFERTVTLAMDDAPAVIADRVRETLDE